MKEGIWNSGKQEAPNLGHKPRQKEGYFPVPPVDSMQDLRTEMVLTLEPSGSRLRPITMRWQPPARRRSTCDFTTLTRMADNLMLYKYVIKNVARKHGMTATFMPKPLFEDNASGMHVHQSLWKGKIQPVLQRRALRQLERPCPPLHRRLAETCLGALRTLCTDHQLLPSAGARL